MKAFATYEDFVARYGAKATEEVVTECLDDASAAIRAELEKAKVPYDDPTDEFADRLMRVCRSVASRIVPNDTDAVQGVTSVMEQAGPYMTQMSFATSYGTPKLLPSEYALLGISGARGRMLHPQIGACHG